MNKTGKWIIGILLFIVAWAILIMYDPFDIIDWNETPASYKISASKLEFIKQQAFEDGKYIGRSAMATYFYEYLSDSVKCNLCNDTTEPVTLQLDRVLEIEDEYTEDYNVTSGRDTKYY